MSGEAPESGVERGRDIVVINYDQSGTDREQVGDLDAALDRVGRRKVTWIIISGRPEGRDLAVLRNRLGVHPVMIEELAEDQPGRPKLIDYRDLILVSWKVLTLDGVRVLERRATCLLGGGFLVTVVPPRHDHQKTMEALLSEHNQLKSMGADYLLYELIDTTIDNYFAVSEGLGDLIEEAQDQVMASVDRSSLLTIQSLRRALITVRKAIWPMREAVNALIKGQSDLVDDYTAPYFRDAYDHTIELMDTVDTHRDMLSEMLDVYQSEVSNQLNQVVKVLTLISVTFAPLTFIVGLYGMNFEHMPELPSVLGYPAVLLLMLSIAVAMVLMFRRKGWL